MSSNIPKFDINKEVIKILTSHIQTLCCVYYFLHIHFPMEQKITQ